MRSRGLQPVGRACHGPWKPCWAQSWAEATLRTTSPAWHPEAGKGGLWVPEAHRDHCGVWGGTEAAVQGEDVVLVAGNSVITSSRDKAPPSQCLSLILQWGEGPPQAVQELGGGVLPACRGGG